MHSAAVYALLGHSMATSTRSEANTHIVARLMAVYMSMAAASASNPPSSISARPVCGTIYAAQSIAPAAMHTIRLAAYMLPRLWPTMHLLRSVPSPYSVPMNSAVTMLVSTAAKNTYTKQLPSPVQLAALFTLSA